MNKTLTVILIFVLSVAITIVLTFLTIEALCSGYDSPALCNFHETYILKYAAVIFITVMSVILYVKFKSK